MTQNQLVLQSRTIMQHNCVKMSFPNGCEEELHDVQNPSTSHFLFFFIYDIHSLVTVDL